MAYPNTLTVRSAEVEDRHRLANLLHFESHVHTHLDWRRPMDWIGKEPFLVLYSKGRLEAALACPPDPPGVAWLRVFGVSSRIAVEEGWQQLWGAALKQLKGRADFVIAIPMQSWTEKLLQESGFDQTHDVVVLDWLPSYGEPANSTDTNETHIREMQADDLQAVCDIDHSSFPALWQNSLESIQFAFGQASQATVIEKDGQVCAYQISTQNSHGLHLARLAVHPDFQGQGMAFSMVRNLQKMLSEQEGQRLTVNTQGTNKPSLALYQKACFRLTGDKLPVYELQISP